MKTRPQTFFVKDDGIFPNNKLPVVYYAAVLDLPRLFPGLYIKKLFSENNWTNNWKQGIFTYHHYHSITHEVLGICSGETLLQLGGENGITLFVEKGDVLIIPAGVAHMNLGEENDISCVGAYPDGKDYDMNYGKPGERPKADQNIALVPLPKMDPVFGTKKGLVKLWRDDDR
ncbi:MAG: cupin [Flavisolibacter sp.]